MNGPTAGSSLPYLAMAWALAPAPLHNQWDKTQDYLLISIRLSLDRRELVILDEMLHQLQDDRSTFGSLPTHQLLDVSPVYDDSLGNGIKAANSICNRRNTLCSIPRDSWHGGCCPPDQSDE
jgi:hypothetical protein